MFGSITNSIESWGRKNEMTRLEFDALVERARIENEQDASRYKTRVVLFGLLGYIFIFTVVGIILTLSIYAFVFYFTHHHRHSVGGAKILFLLVITCGILLYSLWVKNPPPTGAKITRNDCPELFVLIDEISAALQVKIDEVLLDDQMNAYVCQIPRLGVLGWNKNYLVLGYPYMASRDPLLFKATLAHEFGHISGSHGKLGAWLFTVNGMYSQLLGNLREGSPLLYCVFFAFFHWYAPRFGAYSFVLRRQHEYDADLMAIQLAGAEANSLDLISMNLIGQSIAEKFWPEIRRLADTQEHPPEDVMKRIVDFVQLGVDDETAEKWYQESLHMRTETSDSHPSLLDRLIFAKYPAKTKEEIVKTRLPFSKFLKPSITAAQRYLGAKELEYQDALSKFWAASSEYAWDARFKEAAEYRKELENLETKRLTTELDKDELLTVASLTFNLYGKEKGLPIVSEVLAKYPDDSWSNYVIGAHKIDEGDESGVALIETAMSTDVSRVPDACMYLANYYKRSGRHDQAEQYMQRIDSFERDVNFATDERMILRDSDEFEAHKQPDRVIDSLKQTLESVKELKCAYLARKRVTYLPDIPCYILGLQFKAGLDLNGDRNIVLMESIRMAIYFPGDIRLFMVNGKQLAKMANCEGALLIKR